MFQLLIVIVGSVSDLLDYINPSHDTSGRDNLGTKKKNYVTNVSVVWFVSLFSGWVANEDFILSC